MNFIRQNIFYVVLIGVLVVLSGVGGFLIYSVGDENDQRIAGRMELLGKIDELRNPPFFNERHRLNEENRVKDIKKQAGDVTDMCVVWNKRNFKVLEYPAPEGGARVAVFPFNPDMDSRNGAYKLIIEYLDQLKAMSNQLKPTVPPTQPDITREAQKAMMVKGTTRPAAPAVNPAEPATPMPLRGLPPPPPGGMRGLPPPPPGNLAAGTPMAAGVEGSAAGVIDEKTLSEARDAVKVDKASAGQIYIDDDALEKVFNAPATTASASKLWDMQLSLWVQADILGAISDTIDQTLGNAAGKSPTVMDSPVKRLMKITILPGTSGGYYVTSGAAGLAAPGPAPAMPMGPGMGRGMNPLPPPPGGMNPLPPPPGGMNPLPPPPGGMVGLPPPPGGPAGGSTTPSGAIIGGKTSTKDYDVIRYSVTVIMPARYVPLLEKCLMTRNFHTVYNIEMDEEPVDAASLYYYGKDPIMKVKIEGQMLLLTAWERGTVVAKDGQKVVKYPPLMPVDVLKMLPADALRPEDSERINQPAPR